MDKSDYLKRLKRLGYKSTYRYIYRLYKGRLEARKKYTQFVIRELGLERTKGLRELIERKIRKYLNYAERGKEYGIRVTRHEVEEYMRYLRRKFGGRTPQQTIRNFNRALRKAIEEADAEYLLDVIRSYNMIQEAYMLGKMARDPDALFHDLARILVGILRKERAEEVVKDLIDKNMKDIMYVKKERVLMYKACGEGVLRLIRDFLKSTAPTHYTTIYAEVFGELDSRGQQKDYITVVIEPQILAEMINVRKIIKAAEEIAERFGGQLGCILIKVYPKHD